MYENVKRMSEGHVQTERWKVKERKGDAAASRRDERREMTKGGADSRIAVSCIGEAVTQFHQCTRPSCSTAMNPIDTYMHPARCPQPRFADSGLG